MGRTRGDRIANTEKFIKRQVEIQKRTGFEVMEPHRYAKQHAMDCGKPDCYLCGNRRQHAGKTVQEQSFEQTENWYEP